MKNHGYIDRRPRRWPWYAAGVLLLALVLVLTHALWLRALASYLIQSTSPASADAVLVLAGDTSGTRLLTGADLVKRGFASKVLVSGPGPLYGQHESDLAIAYAVNRGYPLSMFVNCRNRAHSTREEAQALLPTLRAMGVHRLDLVTSNYHTRRAGKVYRSLAPDLEIRTIASPDPAFLPDRWWQDRESRKTFLYEWMKTVGYWLGM